MALYRLPDKAGSLSLPPIQKQRSDPNQTTLLCRKRARQGQVAWHPVPDHAIQDFPRSSRAYGSLSPCSTGLHFLQVATDTTPRPRGSTCAPTPSSKFVYASIQSSRFTKGPLPTAHADAGAFLGGVTPRVDISTIARPCLHSLVPTQPVTF